MEPWVSALLSAHFTFTHFFPTNHFRALKARGQVEQWLAYVESAMFEAIKNQLKKSLPELHRTEFTKWIYQQHGQIVLTSSQIDFTGCVEAILNSSQNTCQKSLENVAIGLKKKLDDLALMVLTEPSLTRRNIIVSLMITLVHQRDTVNSLLNDGVNEPDDFQWIRYYYYNEDIRKSLYFEPLNQGFCLMENYVSI